MSPCPNRILLPSGDDTGQHLTSGPVVITCCPVRSGFASTSCIPEMNLRRSAVGDQSTAPIDWLTTVEQQPSGTSVWNGPPQISTGWVQFQAMRPNLDQE